MASIGQIVNPTPGSDALSRARQRAALVPDCLVEAKRIANTVIAGWHGRRKRGIGEISGSSVPMPRARACRASIGAAPPATTIPMCASANGRQRIRSGSGATCRPR